MAYWASDEQKTPPTFQRRFNGAKTKTGASFACVLDLFLWILKTGKAP